MYLLFSLGLLDPETAVIYIVQLLFVAPVPCTDGHECDGNADGLTSCPAGGGICKGKLLH